MEWTTLLQVFFGVFAYSVKTISFSSLMSEGRRCSTWHLSTFHRCSIGFKSGDMLGHWSIFTFLFFKNADATLVERLGSLSCWKISPVPRCLRDGIIFSFKILQYTSAFMILSMKWISPSPRALMQPKPWGCLHHVWLLVQGSYLCIPLLGDATRIERHRNQRDLFWFHRTTKLNPKKTWIYLYDCLQTANDLVSAWALEKTFYVAVIHVDFHHVLCAVSSPQKHYYQWFQVQYKQAVLHSFSDFGQPI